MATFEPYAEGHYQSAAEVAKSAHDLYMMPASMQSAAMPSARAQSGVMQQNMSRMPQSNMAQPMAGANLAARDNMARQQASNGMAGAQGSVAQQQTSGGMAGAQGGMAQQQAAGMTAPRNMCRYSTRNLLRGRVSSLTPGAVNAMVVVSIGGGQMLTVSVTMDSLRDMGLRVGTQVTVAINPNDMLLISC